MLFQKLLQLMMQYHNIQWCAVNNRSHIWCRSFITSNTALSSVSNCHSYRFTATFVICCINTVFVFMSLFNV